MQNLTHAYWNLLQKILLEKRDEQFLDWLREGCEEVGYTLEGVLDSDFSVVQDNYLLEKMFDESKKELISDTSKLWGK